MNEFPSWLNVIAWMSLASGVATSLWIVIDLVAGNKQRMWIMNIVWPLTALYSGLLGLYAYYKVGRLSTQRRMHEAKKLGKELEAKRKPFWQSVAVGATHCGAGCALGDLISENLVLFVPVSLFGHAMFGTWLIDYVAAFILGVAFQYLTIKPMRNLSPSDGLKAALKADTASLTAWQIGMYGWMAIATFIFFGHELPKNSPVFWFMMQWAMLAGFVTAFPINWWLIRSEVKEKM